MSSSQENSELFIQNIIRSIEREFPGAIVVWTGTGCPDDELDETEVFEAYMIKNQDYSRFEDYVWDLEEKVAEPNGFSIMVHGLSPEVTLKYRNEEYCGHRYIREIQKLQEEHKRIKDALRRPVAAQNIPLAVIIGLNSIYSDTNVIHSTSDQIKYAECEIESKKVENPEKFWGSMKLQKTKGVDSPCPEDLLTHHYDENDKTEYQPNDHHECRPNGEAKAYAAAA